MRERGAILDTQFLRCGVQSQLVSGETLFFADEVSFSVRESDLGYSVPQMLSTGIAFLR